MNQRHWVVVLLMFGLTGCVVAPPHHYHHAKPLVVKKAVVVKPVVVKPVVVKPRHHR